MQPGDTNRIAFLQVGYARTDRGDNASTFVARNKILRPSISVPRQP